MFGETTVGFDQNIFSSWGTFFDIEDKARQIKIKTLNELFGRGKGFHISTRIKNGT